MIKRTDKGKDRFTSSTPAVEQAGEIIKFLASHPAGKGTLTEISRGVGINVSKTYVILDALRKSGFISKERDGKLYSLGLGLISIGKKAAQNANYRDAVRPFLEEIARETGSTAFLRLIEDDRTIVVALETSGKAVDTRLQVGDVRPLYYQASGKVVAAYLSRKEQELIIKEKRHSFYTKGTKLNAKDILKDLETCRQNGFAHQVIDSEPYAMVHAIASAVLDVTNTPMGCFVAIGLFPQSSVSVYGPKIADAARRFSTSLGANITKVK
jgi:IclR family KDG regulon transcriptional repressor